MKNFILLISAIFLGSTTLAQVTAGDCDVAINICSNAGFTVDPNGFGAIDELGDGFSTGLISNPGTNPNIINATGFANSGCLMSGELNSTWMVINISSNGALEFSFGIDGGTNCYDWIMWQYDANACADIQGNTLAPIACNWNGLCESFTGMAGGPNGSALPTGGDQSNFEDALSVQCGEQYLVCFSNYSSAATNVPLNFFGSAGIACNFYNPITVTDTTVCEGLCVDLIAQGGNTYTWTPNADLSATTGNTVTACPTTIGSHDYYVTGVGACGTGTDTATVTVVPLPQTSITQPGAFAPTDPPTALNASPGGGSWSSNCGACIDPVTGMFDPSVAGTGTWQICYTAGVTPCDSTACIDIAVGCTPPILDAMANVVECDNYVLPAITGTGLSGSEAYFTLTGGNGTQFAPGDIITSTTSLFIFDETGTGCTHEIPFTITIHISPNAGLDNDTTLCSNNGTFDLNLLLQNEDPGGVWTETTASGQFNTTTGELDNNGLNGIFDFTYTANGTAPCIDDVSNFTVTLISGAPILNSPGNLQAICDISEQPAYPDLATFIAQGGTITGPNSTVDPTTFTLLSEVSDGNSCPEQVVRIYEVANDCGFSDTCMQIINIMDDVAPTAPAMIALNVSCPSDVPVPDVTTVNASDNCTAVPTVVHIGDVSDGNTCNNETITRTYRITDDCGNSTDIIQTITIDAQIPTINAGVDLTVCEGQDVTLTADNPTGATIAWSSGITDGVSFTPSLGVNEYIVGAQFCSGLCISSDTVLVTVVSAPTVLFTADTLSGCQPLNVEFSNLTNQPGVDCVWNFGDGPLVNDCGTVTHNYLSAGSYTVSLTVTNAAGCTGTTTYTDYITVHPIPVAQFAPSPWEIDVTDTEVTMINSTVHGTEYYWDFGDGTTASGIENPSHMYQSTPGAIYEIMLATESEFGCVDTTYRTISIKDVLIFYIPNAFTPDQDEYNNTFQPVFSQGFDPYDFHFTIFDRWGEIIFESYDATVGWDGTYRGQRLAQDGTYVWTVDFKESMSDKRHSYQGHLSLIR